MISRLQPFFPRSKGPSGGDDRPGPALRHRRLGARLLPAVQERAARLRQGHLPGGQLEGRGRQAGQGEELIRGGKL